MKRYLEQLIEDLHKATSNMKPPNELWDAGEANQDEELTLEDISQSEKYVYGDETPISEITGIDQKQLPPVEKLTQEQQALLSAELEELLYYFHFQLDFPDNYPAHLRYTFILKFWEEKHVALSFGTTHIEFCDYDEEQCPFPGYCNSCKEAAEYIKSDKEHVSKDNVEDIKNEQYPFEPSNDEEPYTEDINGFYDDDGNKIDLNSVPVPNLCTICKKYQLDDWDENLLCMMNRNDQSDQPDFKCGAFETI